MRIKKENSSTINITVNDGDGDLVTNLATADDVKFMVKKKKTDTNANAVISKNIGNGVTINDPSVGIVKVTLTSTDTNIDIGFYFMALQIEYSATDIQEINLEKDDCATDILEIYQDIIRG